MAPHSKLVEVRLKVFNVKLVIPGIPSEAEEALQAEIDYVTDQAIRNDGETGQYFWVFAPPHHSGVWE